MEKKPSVLGHTKPRGIDVNSEINITGATQQFHKRWTMVTAVYSVLFLFQCNEGGIPCQNIMNTTTMSKT